MAEEAKAKGNAAYYAGNYQEAIRHFTEAITLSPTNHLLYSNRSAAYAALSQFPQALTDAQRTVELKPDWAKGYSRLGSAYLGLNKIAEAVESYQSGLEIEPNNQGLKSGFQDAQARVEELKSSIDPKTREYMDQPMFASVVADVARNPNNLNMHLEDPRKMHALYEFFNFGMRAGAGPSWLQDAMDEAAIVVPGEDKEKRERGVGSGSPGSGGEMGEEKEKTESKAEAVKDKEAGNAPLG